MESKINSIESEMKEYENSKKTDSFSDKKNSTTISYKNLLERLLDRSDIDN